MHRALMASSLTLLLLCFAVSVQCMPTPPAAEPWFGDFMGALHDPENASVKGDVYLVNETALQIINFTYNGQAPDVYFWANRQPALSSDGVKIPSFEFGSTPLGKYENAERVVLVLPDHYKIEHFSTVGLWCLQYAKNFGSVKLDKGRDPPKAQFLKQQLVGNRYSVGSGPILILDRRTIKVYGFTFDGDKAPDGYFYVGKGTEPDHNGIKVPIRGRDTPDAITAMNERYKGGQDLIIELPESHDVYHIDWLSVYCYKFRINFGHVRLDDISPRIPPYVPQQKRYDDLADPKLPAWNTTVLLGTDARTNFTFQLGPPGNRRGYQALARARPNDQVWYINGYMTPEIYLRRGVSYTFNVEGGDDKASFYNPLYISDDPFGGYMKLSSDERQQVRILAGAMPKSGSDNTVSDNERSDMMGKMLMGVGRLCLWMQDKAEDEPDDYEQFAAYRDTLTLMCTKDGQAGTFRWKPDQSTPDTVYYQSYTNYNMGWKIHVVDEIPSNIPDFTEKPFKYEVWLQHQSLREAPSSGCSSQLRLFSLLTIILTLISSLFYIDHSLLLNSHL